MNETEGETRAEPAEDPAQEEVMDAVQAKQIDDSLPVQIKVGLSEHGYVVIQSMGNDVVAPNFLVLSKDTAREIAQQIMSLVK